MPIIGNLSATPSVELSTGVEYGWVWGKNADGDPIADEGHRSTKAKIFRRDCFSATAIIYADNTNVGATYYLENRDCRLKGPNVYTCVETWRNVGSWATTPLV